MATRNRTKVYIESRNEQKRIRRAEKEAAVFKKQNRGYNAVGTESLIPKDEPDAYELEERGVRETQLGLTVPPAWMSLVDQINYEMTRIKTKS